ncbi:unnamed protein product [Phyllotreta striolata]|uniref:Major facilitator superfamily (MFS) profile domain-containing protein n=1 Tax=Phyllotreta striolata TaxID=444603 RepID=A0A9N9TJT7_PHYSR|nr:unnamed protein product [Phyllotreta striolata]
MIINSFKYNYYLYWAACSVNFLGINTGGVWSWASPSLPILKSNDTSINPVGRPITSYEESLIASLAILGSVVGTLAGGVIGEKFGRKRTLMVFSSTFLLGNVVIANSTRVIYFFVIRFIVGLGAGCSASLIPLYIGELSEDSNRGALGSMFGLMLSVGNFLSFAVGPLLDIKTFAYVLLVPVTLFFIVVVPFVPESPYYYLSIGKTDDAKNALKKIRINNIEKEFIGLSQVVEESLTKKATLKDLFASRASRRGLLIVITLLQFQQYLGISVVLTYLQPILEASGNIIPAYIASIIIATIQVIFSCVVTAFVDKVGRKILLYVSSIGCSASLLALGIYFILQDKNYDMNSVFWVPLASLILYYVCFNLGIGPIPFIISGEILATNYKSLSASVSTCLFLLISFIITMCFPFVRDAFGMGVPFCVFSALGSLAVVFVFFFVPETKGKSFQEIQDELRRK